MSEVGGTDENDSCPKLQRDENIILITIEFFHRNFGSISWSRDLKSKSGAKPRSCVSRLIANVQAATRSITYLTQQGLSKLVSEGMTRIVQALCHRYGQAS